MRRLLKNGGQLLSCNLEKKGTRVAGLAYAVQLRWRNYHRTKCANARRKIIEKNRIRRGKRVSIFVLDALSSLLSSLSPLSSVRATFEVHRQSLWCLPGLASHKRKWHFCVPVTNASRNNFVFFADYLLNVTRFLVAISGLSGREREWEREGEWVEIVERNKRIKKIYI